jgi:hypothetical protein
MKKVSDTLTELGIAFTFPIEITNANGNRTYYEDSAGYWGKREYDTNGNPTYYENSTGYWNKCKYDANNNSTYFESNNGYWWKYEYDADGNETYYENSNGCKEGTPRSQSCTGKVIEVDGKKYKLKEL